MSWRASPWLSTADVQSFLDLLPNSWSLERESRHPPAIHKLLYLLLIKNGNGKNLMWECEWREHPLSMSDVQLDFPSPWISSWFSQQGKEKIHNHNYIVTLVKPSSGSCTCSYIRIFWCLYAPYISLYPHEMAANKLLKHNSLKFKYCFPNHQSGKMTTIHEPEIRSFWGSYQVTGIVRSAKDPTNPRDVRQRMARMARQRVGLG